MGQRRALVVGIDHYDTFPDLRCAVRDAQRLANLFARNDDGSILSAGFSEAESPANRRFPPVPSGGFRTPLEALQAVIEWRRQQGLWADSPATEKPTKTSAADAKTKTK